jgi:hypothetical protein
MSVFYRVFSVTESSFRDWKYSRFVIRNRNGNCKRRLMSVCVADGTSHAVKQQLWMRWCGGAHLSAASQLVKFRRTASCATRTPPSHKPVFFTSRVNHHPNPAACAFIPVSVTLTLCGTCFGQDTKRYKTEKMDPNEFFAVLHVSLVCLAICYECTADCARDKGLYTYILLFHVYHNEISSPTVTSNESCGTS